MKFGLRNQLSSWKWVPRLGKDNKHTFLLTICFVRKFVSQFKIFFWRKVLKSLNFDWFSGLPGSMVTHNGYEFEIPKGQMWLEGDNKSKSLDSRVFGPVSIGLFEGLVFCRISPFTTYLKKSSWWIVLVYNFNWNICLIKL